VTLTGLYSPRQHKQKEPDGDLTVDEQNELKKQQKARLRNLVHEKRKREKRAAMVDKVLRGVTSKRRRVTLANEALAAQVGSRLSNIDAKAGFIRYRSGPTGSFVSVAPGEELPLILSTRMKADGYPPQVERDSRTGKRIMSPGAERAAEDHVSATT
jgi:hypothetical protein